MIFLIKLAVITDQLFTKFIKTFFQTETNRCDKFLLLERLQWMFEDNLNNLLYLQSIYKQIFKLFWKFINFYLYSKFSKKIGASAIFE